MPQNLPRLIHFDEDTKLRLVSYLETELLNHFGERGAWVEDLISLQTDYFAEPTTEKKTFPFVGAANIVIPLMRIVVNALHAKAMTTLFALDDFASVKVPGVYEDINWGLSKFVNYELLESGVDMYKFSNNSLLEFWKLGSCVGKVGYEKITKTAVRTLGDKETEFEVTTKQGAVADAVPLANFLMPFSAQDPQTAPWCGEEHTDTAFEVKLLCDSGFFYDDAWEELEKWVLQTNTLELSSSQYRQNLENLQDQSPVWPKLIGWIEIWLSFDVDGSDKQKEIVVYYHRLSRTVIGARYNWYDDLRRPYRIGTKTPVEHRWAGIGCGKEVQQFQREITIQHRQRLDNATIANIRMFKINKLSGYGPGEPIFPGKLWFVDSMDDIESLEAGEIYPSSFNDEIQTLNYAQQDSGINELNLGMPIAGTPGTATENTNRLQEGNRKYDYTHKNLKRFLTEISRDVVYNVCQFGPRSFQIFDYIPNGDQVKIFIQNAPLSLIREQLICNITLIGENENKLQDRANWTQLSGILSQYYEKMIEFAQLTQDKNLLGMLAKVIPSGATEAMKQILESFDSIRNLDRIIPEQLIIGYNPTGISNPSVLSTLPNINNGAPNLRLISPNPQEDQNGNTGSNFPGISTGTQGTSQA